jgi:hypothetical protein
MDEYLTMRDDSIMAIIYKGRTWLISIDSLYISYRPLSDNRDFTHRKIILPERYHTGLAELNNMKLVDTYLVAWDHLHIAIMGLEDILFGKQGIRGIIYPKTYATYIEFHDIGVLDKSEGAYIEDIVQAGANTIAVGLTCDDESSCKKFAKVAFIDIENNKVWHTGRLAMDTGVKKLAIYNDDKVLAICCQPLYSVDKKDDLRLYGNIELYIIDPATALVVSKEKLDDDE